MLLKDKTSFYKICFDSMRVGILVFDQQRNIVLVNEPLSALFGVEQHLLLQKKVDDFLKDKTIINTYIQDPNHKKFKSSIELNGYDIYGKDIFLELSLGKMEYEGELYFKALISNISLRKLKEVKINNLNVQLEEEVKIRNLELEVAIKKLEKALEKEKELNILKTRFIAQVSHEFKTPMSAILSSTELMAKYAHLNNVEKLKEHLEKVKLVIGRLNGMLDDLLTLENIESGRIHPTLSYFNNGTLIQEIIDATHLFLKENQTFELKIINSELVYYDGKIIKIIITNLLYNAIKFSTENSVIKVEVYSNDTHLYFKVEDTGIGIPKSEQHLIFNRFFRAKNAISFPGTGVGLNIIKGYINSFNGKISFKSIENKGSIFIVELPKIVTP